MLQILLVTGPIYLLIALGYVSVRQGWVDKGGVRVLGRFVAMFCVPALLLRSLSRQPLGQTLDMVYLAAYAGGALLVAGLMLFYVLRVTRRPLPLAAMMALGSSMPNSAFIGYPVVLQLIGPLAAPALALSMLVENLLIMPLCLALADSSGSAGGWREALRRSLSGLVRNPMILAIAAGVALAALGWHVPPVVDKALEMLAAVASLVALFAVGGTLFGQKAGGMLRDALQMASAKLLLQPLAVLLILWLLPATDPSLHLAAVVFAAMPTAAIFPVLAQRYQHEGLSATALLMATGFSFVTITLLLMALGPH